MAVWALEVSGKKFVLENEKQVILGKNPECEIRCDHAEVSRRHLALNVHRGKLLVRDLGSTNGTFYRGKRLPADADLCIEECSEIFIARGIRLLAEPQIEALVESSVPEANESGIAAREHAGELGLIYSEVLRELHAMGDLGAGGGEEKLERILKAEKFQCLGEALKCALKKEILGSGPLEDFLLDPRVSEIVVNGSGAVWVERSGTMLPTGTSFFSEQSLLHFIRRILAPIGRSIDPRRPIVDARLPDGCRVCAVTAPAVLGGTHLAIRKFSSSWNRIDSLESAGSLSEAAGKYLRRAIAEKKNILISGPTGAGKTSLLNALSGLIAHDERILTLEDTCELQIDHPHVVRLEGHVANLEGEGEISIRQLLKTALRLRPDRIILGECRGAEAIDLLQALNTGHAGSMATIHANSNRDALARLELLTLLASENALNPLVARSYIASAIQVLVHITRAGGRRFISAIDEISGVEENIVLLKRVEI